MDDADRLTGRRKGGDGGWATGNGIEFEIDPISTVAPRGGCEVLDTTSRDFPPRVIAPGQRDRPTTSSERHANRPHAVGNPEVVRSVGADSDAVKALIVSGRWQAALGNSKLGIEGHEVLRE
jgi:hypothetical protein